MNRHPRAGDEHVPANRGGRRRPGTAATPVVTTAASSQADTVSAGQPARRRGRCRCDRHHRVAQHAARRVQRHRIHRQDPGQPGEELPHPRPPTLRNRRSRSRTVSSGTPLAAAIDRNPWPRAARASMSPITPVPSHRRASSHAGSRTCVDTARAAPRPPRAHRHREPARREDPPPDRMTPPAQPATAARTRKQAVTEQRLDAAMLLPTVSNGASAHPHGPPRASRKGNGEGRPLTRHAHGVVARHPTATRTTTKTTLTSKDATTPKAFTLNGG